MKVPAILEDMVGHIMRGETMKTILFQGDSITDGGRNRQDPLSLGAGYPAYVAARLGLERPEAYAFYNRGLAGNHVVDIYARVKKDIINIKPDYMSLMVGVNDIWHELDFQTGIDIHKFEKIYSMLIEEVLEELPLTKLLLIEPFVLKGKATAVYYEALRQGVEARAEIVRRIALKYQLPVLSMQKDLDILQQGIRDDYWLYDGAHPTIYFHQYIADRWMEWFHDIEKQPEV